MKNTLLKNASVLTMDSPHYAENTDVLISGRDIARVGRNIAQDGAEAIDCTGRYIMPGLIDMHTHTASSDTLPLFIALGVTTVRNMWGMDIIRSWGERIEAGTLDGPSIISTGRLTDGVESWAGALCVKTPEEAIKAVEDEYANGYREMKTYPSIPRDAYFALASACRAHGMRVVGHGNRFVTFRELADSFYSTIEHANNLPESDSDLEYLAKTGVCAVPTFTVVRAMYRYIKEGKPISSFSHYEYVNPRDRRDWEGILLSLRDMRLPDDDVYLDRVRRFRSFGGRVFAGTDNMNPGSIAGFSLDDEIADLKDILGVSSYEAIEMATSLPADYLKAPIGRVREGARADLLILERDPLLDISALSAIDTVIHAGRTYPRAALDSLLCGVKALSEEDIVFAAENKLVTPTGRA